MEHMLGSLDRVSRLLQKKGQKYPEPVLGKIAVHVRSVDSHQHGLICLKVLRGLIYLKNRLKVMHRGGCRNLHG